jgi:hypothetical protein
MKQCVSEKGKKKAIKDRHYGKTGRCRAFPSLPCVLRRAHDRESVCHMFFYRAHDKEKNVRKMHDKQISLPCVFLLSARQSFFIFPYITNSLLRKNPPLPCVQKKRTANKYLCRGFPPRTAQYFHPSFHTHMN